MVAPILNLQNISYSLGGHPLLDGADLSLEAGERVCLVGRNGCGKSTFLKIAARQLQEDHGLCFVQPGIKTYYLPQEPDLSQWESTLDYVLSSLDETAHYRARALLHELELTGAEKCASLSGGEARRCALARALAYEPDLILLDEPTNHLDLHCISWLEKELLASQAAMVIISHDRRFLETLCRAVIWLENGKTQKLEANFSQFEEWRDEQIALSERETHKLERKIAREEDWMRYGVTARRKRNVRRVAELKALKAEKKERLSLQRGALKITASEAENTSKIVISAESLSYHYPDKDIVHGLDLKIMRGDCLGLCGANGVGKSTLLNLLTGKIRPQKGEVKLSPSMKMVALDQQRTSLDPQKTIIDILTDGTGDYVQVGQEKRHVMGYMKDFLFRPEQGRTIVSHLSGGERGRLALACALARPSNLLILDEPTNDLDLETLDLLQEMITNYEGTVLLVSHDRDFLDRLATSILVSEGNGQWIEYAGGYSDMLTQRREKEIQARIVHAPPSSLDSKNNQEDETTQKQKKKLSYKEQRELDLLPQEIEKIDKDIFVCQNALHKPDLFHQEPAKFEKISLLLQELEEKKRHLEERWLILEEKRENLA